MTTDAELINLERSAWHALSVSGEAAAAFFGEVLARDVLILLPGGMVVDDRAAAIDLMSGPPWTSFELAEERVRRLSGQVAVVCYHAVAHRGDTRYEALLSSTYVRTNGDSWRLAVHQQTQIER